MSDAVPYLGPVEAMTIEEAAFRIRRSADYFKKHYPGPYTYLSEDGQGEPRVPAYGLHDWIVQSSRDKGAATAPSAWDNFGNGGKKGKPGRPQRLRERQADAEGER